MVVLVLLGIVLLQEEITYSTTFGRLEHLIRGPEADTGILAVGWSVVRTLSIVAVAGLWILNRKPPLFKAIVGVNGLLTVGLLLNVIALTEFVFRLTPRASASRRRGVAEWRSRSTRFPTSLRCRNTCFQFRRRWRWPGSGRCRPTS